MAWDFEFSERLFVAQNNDLTVADFTFGLSDFPADAAVGVKALTIDWVEVRLVTSGSAGARRPRLRLSTGPFVSATLVSHGTAPAGSNTLFVFGVDGNFGNASMDGVILSPRPQGWMLAPTWTITGDCIGGISASDVFSDVHIHGRMIYSFFPAFL